MTGPDDGERARLLAGRDRLTQYEKEQIFDRDAGALRQSPAGWVGYLSLAIASAAALLFFFVLPTDRGEFASRGSASQPAFEIYCSAGGSRAPCRTGAKLLFQLTPTKERCWFAAFSRRSDGTVI